MSVSVKVYSKYQVDVPSDAVYVGRPTKWGNPYSHMPNTLAEYKVSSREEAVALYEDMLLNNPEMLEAAKMELRGKDLVCWCKPRPCHADILLRIANEPD